MDKVTEIVERWNALQPLSERDRELLRIMGTGTSTRKSEPMNLSSDPLGILPFLRLEVAFYRKESSLYKVVEGRGVLVFAPTILSYAWFDVVFG